jgi:hypothetical protein
VEKCATFKEKFWLQKVFSGFFGLKLEANFILCENQSCMMLS